MHKCTKCDKSFKSELALRGHQRVHSENYEQVQQIHRQRLEDTTALAKNKRIVEYNKNPLRCLHCDTIIPYEKTVADSGERKFCNRSCSASYTNKLRSPKSRKTKDKISKSLISKTAISSDGHTFSRIFNNVCAHCKNKFVSRKNTKYCKIHLPMYKDRNVYAFNFAFQNHLKLFEHMLPTLKELGMWNKDNRKGLSRDHKVSVNESIRNNYDPYYISHPVNCELMSWDDNLKKRTASSLTYKKLKILVDEYDSSTKP